MSFVTVGGDGSTRPTFFELVAAERLMPSLKAAATYSLSVFAQRRPAFHRLLDWEDECFALVTALLDRQALVTSSASFADSLYGLRRVPVDSPADSGAGTSGSGDGAARSASAPARALSRAQQRMTLLLLVGLPYVMAKLDALYSRHRTRVDGVLGLGLARLQRQATPPAQPGDAVRRLATPCMFAQAASGSWLPRLRAATLAAFLRAYPWLHAGQEAARFAYQLAYLLDRTPYYSPALHLLRQRVARVSGHELVEAERSTRSRRAAELGRARAKGALPARLAREGFLRAGYALADHTRNALILSVFAFKILEWWYTSGEEKLASQKALPPPPPPPAPRPAPDGVPLPEDRAMCPLCQQARTNPAMTTVSGYAFCYPCIFTHVEQHGRCPVTHIPATVDTIRRLYQST